MMRSLRDGTLKKRATTIEVTAQMTAHEPKTILQVSSSLSSYAPSSSSGQMMDDRKLMKVTPAVTPRFVVIPYYYMSSSGTVSFKYF